MKPRRRQLQPGVTDRESAEGGQGSEAASEAFAAATLAEAGLRPSKPGARSLVPTALESGQTCSQVKCTWPTTETTNAADDLQCATLRKQEGTRLPTSPPRSPRVFDSGLHTGVSPTTPPLAFKRATTEFLGITYSYFFRFPEQFLSEM